MPIADETHDPIPAPVQSVLSLFEGPLEGVAFPGLDAGVLEERAEDVRGRADDLAEARRNLEEARLQLETSQEDLLSHAKRGLAYAKIFAESDPTLSDEVSSIELNPAAPKKTAKRGRKPADVKATANKKAKAAKVEELPLAAKDAAPEPIAEDVSEEPHDDARLAS